MEAGGAAEMTLQDQEWLTTGQVARLCSVTPGTVLNWIRKGRLEGVRTAGGHHRIRRDQLGQVLPQDDSRPGVTNGDGTSAESLRCWEYFSEGDTIRDGCGRCVVYRLRATRCFRMAALGPEIGHALEHCPTSCEECVYFMRVAGLPTNVLVLSDDDVFVQALLTEDSDGIVLRFARSAYEASALVQDFPPAFAVVDQETHLDRDPTLLESLAHDRRLPGLKVIVAMPPNAVPHAADEPTSRFVVREIEKPFGFRKIAEVIDSFPVEMLEPGELESIRQHLKEERTMVQGHHVGHEASRDADGFLEEMSSWDRSQAEGLALEQDIGELTEDHWKVIEFVQWYYNTYGQGPPVVRVHRETGMTSEDICRLFPCGMVKGAYRLAGLPRPPGCA